MKRLKRSLRPHLPIHTSRYGDAADCFAAPLWEPTNVRTMPPRRNTP